MCREQLIDLVEERYRVWLVNSRVSARNPSLKADINASVRSVHAEPSSQYWRYWPCDNQDICVINVTSGEKPSRAAEETMIKFYLTDESCH